MFVVAGCRTADRNNGRQQKNKTSSSWVCLHIAFCGCNIMELCLIITRMNGPDDEPRTVRRNGRSKDDEKDSRETNRHWTRDKCDVRVCAAKQQWPCSPLVLPNYCLLKKRCRRKRFASFCIETKLSQRDDNKNEKKGTDVGFRAPPCTLFRSGMRELTHESITNRSPTSQIRSFVTTKHSHT
jgi:hypothetical protein